MGAADDAPGLIRVGVGRASSLLAAGDESGVTCPLWGVDVPAVPEPIALVIVGGGAVPLGPGSRTGDGCGTWPRSGTTGIPGLSTIGRLGIPTKFKFNNQSRSALQAYNYICCTGCLTVSVSTSIAYFSAIVEYYEKSF